MGEQALISGKIAAGVVLASSLVSVSVAVKSQLRRSTLGGHVPAHHCWRM
jgi:hypothetical protein